MRGKRRVLKSVEAVHGNTVDLSTPSCACASWEGPQSHVGGHHYLCERFDLAGERQRWVTLLGGLIDEVNAGVANGPHYCTAMKATGRTR
ncbi:hypothetical protein UFOVP1004_16 [uncultured Caudovirales phage]|uniref:Uncharacterized protein n=1 Tax=uncultured Caudovirales phage TaxID=2100421 RepID=A0A6J5QDR4_9CAUD|nr:hypothetical protein UFOVP1004_16 [uncultured Caudovirales phage]